MRILVIQETDWELRGPHQSHHLFERLKLLGHDIRVIDFKFDWSKEKDQTSIFSKRHSRSVPGKSIREVEINIISPPFIKIRGLDLLSIGLTQYFELIRQIRKFKPNIIISFGIVSSISSYIGQKIFRIPFCVYWIDVLHELIPISIFQKLGLSLEKFSIRRASSFLAINERLLSFGKLFKPPKLTLIRAGVDLKKFQPRSTSRNEIRQQFRVGKKECLLFFMGYLYHFSGLIEVLNSLKTGNFPEFKLLIVGDGEQRLKLEELINRYSMHHIVSLLRWQSYEKIPGLISAADICLLPAYPNKIMQDIVPIKLYEYLAMGKPVVTTPLAGVYNEFGQDSGVIYALNSKKVMKKCKQINEHEEIEYLGNLGRKFIEKKCAWDKLVENFLQEMYDVVAG